jgi:hypothetical protein
VRCSYLSYSVDADDAMMADGWKKLFISNELNAIFAGCVGL